MTEVIFSIAASAIIVPWCVWVTHSIYTQRQELAVMKEIFHSIQLMQKKLTIKKP